MTDGSTGGHYDAGLLEPEALAVARRLNAFATIAMAPGAEHGPLAGGTAAIKDSIDVAGMPTSAGGSRPVVALRDAAVVRRLKNAGVTVVGKASMDEWGLGVTGYSPALGQCRNPWDPARMSGGSSSGAAAAVAAGLATIGLGTDSAGSLRIPASLCGVSALKPSAGSVSMRGVLRIAPTLDVVGPIARSVVDCAAADSAIRAAGRPSGTPIRRVGIARGPHWSVVADDVGQAIDTAQHTLETDGIRLADIDVPEVDVATRLNGVVLLYELAHRHRQRWRAERGRLGRRVVRQLELGAAISEAEYREALQFRERWRERLDKLFGTVDALWHATTATTAPRVDERVSTASMTQLCAAWNLAGVPVLALPVGFGRDGLPVGASLVGPAGSEAALLELGMRYQRLTDWHLRRPPVWGAPATTIGGPT